MEFTGIGWTGKFQVYHSKQLTELEKAIENFCKVHMTAQTKRDTSQLKRKTSQILGNTSQISQMLSQILGDRAMISQILEDSSQIKQILEDAVSKILQDRSQISQILEETSQISQMIVEEFKAKRSAPPTNSAITLRCKLINTFQYKRKETKDTVSNIFGNPVKKQT